MASVNRLLSAAANGNGATLDMGAGAAYDKINVEVRAPATVTAYTVTVQGSTDNFTTNAAILAISNTAKASVSLRKTTTYRYLRAVLSAYAGSGNVVADAELGVSNLQN